MTTILTGSTGKGYRSQTSETEYLSDFSTTRESPWDTHRSGALAVETLYLAGTIDASARLAERVKECSCVLEFGWKPNKDTGECTLKFARAQFCHVRHCPVCLWRRSLKWQARLLEAMPAIEGAYPGYRWLFLTLTVKNVEASELRTTIQHLNKSFARLTQVKAWPAKGWVRSLEVTRNEETGDVHPHIHALLLVPGHYFGGRSYLSHEKWRQLWQKAARLDYLPLVNIRTVKERKGATDPMAAAVAETLKYSVKPEDLASSAEFLETITMQLHKTRAVSVGGVLRDFLRADDPEPEEEADDENPGGEFFRFSRRERRYRRKTDDNDLS